MLELLRRRRDFRLLFIAQLVSNCGDWFATVAMLGLVLKATGGAGWATSLVFLSQSLSSFFGSLLGGPVADRFDRRTVMLVVSAAQTVAAGGLILAATTGPWWLVYVGQALIGFLGAFFGPAASAAVPNLVENDELRMAASMIGTVWGAMLAVGAALGAGFTALFGRTASFVADALSFVIAYLLIAGIRASTTSHAAGTARGRPQPLADVREALRYARRDRVTLALLGSKFQFGFTTGVAGMLAVLSADRYGSADWGTGVLLAGRGTGVVFGPVVFQRLLDRSLARSPLAHGPDGEGSAEMRIVRICGLAGFIFGLAYLGVAWSPVLWIGAALVLIAHLGGGGQWTLSTYGLQSRTPDELRGRILAGDFALVTASMSVSFLATSAIESTIGAGPTLALLGSFALVCATLYATITARMRVSPVQLAPTA